jgi:eukaryotic-like serine/threonine-protein kinase
VRLVVSLGPLPDVKGMTLQQAIDALATVNVTGIEGSHTFDDNVPADAVIRVEPQRAGEAISPNDTVLIVISKGVEQVAVPDVVGMTWTSAKQKLTDAGFAVSYNKSADSSQFAVVRSTSPKAGTMQLKGSIISVKFLGE